MIRKKYIWNIKICQKYFNNKVIPCIEHPSRKNKKKKKINIFLCFKYRPPKSWKNTQVNFNIRERVQVTRCEKYVMEWSFFPAKRIFDIKYLKIFDNSFCLEVGISNIFLAERFGKYLNKKSNSENIFHVVLCTVR